MTETCFRLWDRTFRDRRWFIGLLALSILWMIAVVQSLQRHHGLLAAVGIVFLLLASTKTAWLNPSSVGTSRSFHLLAVALPCTLVWGLYYPVTEGGWMHDDPRLIQAAAEHGILAYFYDPTILRTWTTSQLTPWLTLSLGLDFEVLGLRPFGFYLHQLLSLSLVVVLGYRLLCGFFPVVIASMITSLFVVSVPIGTVVQFLMMRHYLDGLLLLCVALLLYAKAAKTNQFSWACGGAFFFLLAGSAKEIFVPWVAVLPFLPLESSWKRRARMAVPYLAVVGGYVLWRSYMLGPQHLLSQHGDLHGKPSWTDLIELPLRISQLWAWTSPWPWMLLLAVSSPWLLSLFRSDRVVGEGPTVSKGGVETDSEDAGRAKYLGDEAIGIDGKGAGACDARPTTTGSSLESPTLRRWVCSILLAVVAGVGLIPVLMILAPRYLMLPTLAVSLLLGAGLNEAARILQRVWIRPLVFGLGLCLLLLNARAVEKSPVWRDRQTVKASRVVADFVLRDGDSKSVLVSSLGSGAFYKSLSWLRTNSLGKGPGPRVCSDLCICPEHASPRAYAYAEGTIHEIDLAAVRQQKDCGRADAQMSVHILFSPEVRTLDWKFGPHLRGQYYYSGPSGEGEVSGHFSPMPPEGSFPFVLSEPLPFVIKYVSEEGWHTYSRRLTLDPSQIGGAGKAELYWERGEDN